MAPQEEKNAASSHAKFFNVPSERARNLAAIGRVTLVCGEPPLAHAKFTSFRVVTDVRCENNDKVLAVRSECFVAAHGDCGAHFAVFERIPVGQLNRLYCIAVIS